MDEGFSGDQTMEDATMSFDSFKSFSLDASRLEESPVAPAFARLGVGLGGIKRSGAQSSLAMDTSGETKQPPSLHSTRPSLPSAPSAPSVPSCPVLSNTLDPARLQSPSRSTKWEVEVGYPILTTRQGGTNTPRRPTGFGVPGFEGVTPGRVVSFGRIEREDREKNSAVAKVQVESNAVESAEAEVEVEVEVALPATATVKEPVVHSPIKTEVGLAVSSVEVAPVKELAKSPVGSVHVDSPVEPVKEVYSEAQVSPKQSPVEGSPIKEPSPIKVSSSPANHALLEKPIEPTPDRASLAHAQPRIISNSFGVPAFDDTSLIGDCGPPSCAGDATDDSFDFAIEDLRPMTARKAHLDLEAAEKLRAAASESPSRPFGATLHPFTLNTLDQSTLLPKSPAKSLHLLQPTHALTRVQPPWEETTMVETGMKKSRSAKSKRTFPASSSGQSLASVGEEVEGPLEVAVHPLEASTLLPASPDKMRHLLRPEAMLQNETFNLIDGPSFAVSQKATQSPVKSHLADTTLDVWDLMAKMTKPKRASGSEESFEDLLRGKADLDAGDVTMEAPNDNIVPASLRPARHLTSPSKHAATPRRLGTTTYLKGPAIDSSGSDSVTNTVRRARRRSKSLSGTVPAPLPCFGSVDSPEKPVRSVGRMVPAAAAPAPRARASLLRPPSGRRISLSAGTLPMPSSASHRKMELGGQSRGAPGTAGAGVARPTPVAPTVVRQTTAVPGLPKPRSGSTTGRDVGRPSAARVGSTALAPPATRAPAARPVTRPAPFAPTTTDGVSRLGRPAQPAGLPRPAADGTARSAPSRPLTREFGADAGRAVNRLSRPASGTASTTGGTVARPAGSKMSLGPISATGKTVARPVTTAKSRALSTPATATALARPATGVRKASVPPGRVVSTRTGSSSSTGLGRPCSKLPSLSSGAKMSTSASMADVRARLDRLQARQVGRK